MRQLSLMMMSSFILAACTQPAVVVENRGAHDYSNGNSGYALAAPVAPVMQAAPTEATPVQLVSVSDSSIAVNDLAPAAGQMEAAPINQWTGSAREENIVTTERLEAPKAAVAKGPYVWPLDSRDVISGFGPKSTGKANDGINIAAASGVPVWASADGEVIYAGSKLKGYGNMVIVKHKGGKTTSYAHLARFGVEKYDRVKQGDILGYVGTSGGVKKPQLYFSMREGSKAVDPRKYIDHSLAALH